MEWKVIQIKETSGRNVPFVSIGRGQMDFNAVACDLVGDTGQFKYAQLLENPTVLEGTVQELADKFEMDLVLFGGGFLDGINDSLKEKNPLETLEADSQVKIDIDLEKLYYNMVAAKADWLYELPQWDNLLSVEKRQELYKAQKRSMIVVKGKKIGRNEPCPCGSGKKYKQCCGR